MEEKTIKIIKKLENKKDDPFSWEVEIDGEETFITSWDERKLVDGATYKIILLDETSNDAKSNMRRMSKPHEPKLMVNDKEVEEEFEEEFEVPEEEKPNKKIGWKKIDPPKKTDNSIAKDLQDDFDDQYGHMIEDEVKETQPKALTINEGSKLELSLENVRKHLATPNVTDSEIYVFLQLCINQTLNPFIGDVYLVKYGPKAQMIVSKDAFLKKAEQTEGYKGFEAGIVVYEEGKIMTLTQRPGSLTLKGEQLVGGWARVHRKDMQPFYAEVSFDEYNTSKAMWKSKPATMIRKVALVQAMREAFPKSFQGMYDSSEIETEAK